MTEDKLDAGRRAYSRPRWTLRSLAAAVLLAAAPAQTLIVQNLAPLPRAEWCAVAVPFAAGKVKATPALVAGNGATVWEPFGGRWPDGSWRQALCLFRAELPALGELAVPLAAGNPMAPSETVAAPKATLTLTATIAGATARATLPAVEQLESNAARQVWLLRARLGDTGLVAEAIVTIWAGQAHAWLDLAVTFSDPQSRDLQRQVDELAVECHGLALVLRHAGRLGVEQQVTADGSRAVLLRAAVLGDGQTLRRNGVLVPPLRGDGSKADKTLQAAAICPLLGATEWSSSGAFGAYGFVPPPPSWLAGGQLRMALANRHRAFAAGDRPGGDPFAAGPFGLAKFAGQTGDQTDFGVVKFSAVAFSGLPSLLFEAEPSLLQECLRPTHNKESDGTPVLAANHPDWVVWAGRTHWHAGVSVDRLGKPAPEPPFEAHGWTGKDREHWSTNHLGAYALLTGAHWARRELAEEVQLYLGGQTLAADKSTSHSGAPRGAGRTELAACWLWLATGDAALRQRMLDRVDRVYLPEWAGRDLPPDKVRTLAVQGPDDRMLHGKSKYWTPWQDAIAAVGFGAVWQMTGNDNARQLAEGLATNVVRHGFKLDQKECWIATAIRWRDDGAPLAPAEINDDTAVLWSYGTDFNAWAIGAVEIARAVAAAGGDQALRERAETILQRIRAARRRPADGFYDRLTEWDAVRWPAAR